MKMVNHNVWGIGRIIKREVCQNGKFIEVNEGGNYITVRFDDGGEKKFAIPKSFENGILEAVGDLKAEVNHAAEALRKMHDEDKAKYGLSDGTRSTEEKGTRSAKQGVKITLTGDIKVDYESYLRESGYEENVVYQYSRAIDIVCKEEGLSPNTLAKKIMSIIKKYDKGGEKEAIGNYQKRTVINALKRFGEFIRMNYPNQKGVLT